MGYIVPYVMAANTDSTEALIRSKLKNQGASPNLAGAIADAAARGGLSRPGIGYHDLGGAVLIHGTIEEVPEEVHDRLTDMGFELNEEMSDAGMVRYDDTK